jgi:glutamyl-Q tRNA(Asp) synthetase
MFLRQMLGLPDPEFGHTPVLRHPDGSKLSKQTGASALNNSKALDNIRAALNALGQPAPSSACKSVGDATAWALDHWDRDRIPTQ